MLEENNIWKILWVFALLLVFLISIPLLMITNMSNTTSFDRHNVYELDGFRNAGYYVERHNLTNDGYMNISHQANTDIIFIDSTNIKNITLDMSMLYQERSYLFNWTTITWLDAVKATNQIVLYINTTDGISNFTFMQYPDVWLQVTIDGVSDVPHTIPDIITTTGLSAGNHIVIIKLHRAPATLYDVIVGVIQVAITLFVMWTTIKMIGDIIVPKRVS